MFPIFLILLAAGAAAIMAFGSNPDLAQHPHGLQILLLTRRYEWPLVAFSLLCCLILLFLVISNKRRAWWLIALGPITALFFYHFSVNPNNFFSIADNPPMLSSDEVSFVRDEDWVVGVQFEGVSYAFPYSSIYSAPVVIESDREKRMILLWSPFANVARAFAIDREIKSREMEIVAMPANALLLYNTRNGQFINGITGLTTTGAVPAEFKNEIPASKMTWKRWRGEHPDSKVMASTGRLAHNPPAAPVLPLYPLPPTPDDIPRDARVVMIDAPEPIAIPIETISSKPLNVMAGKTPVLIFREAASGEIRAFDRRIDEDLMPRFEENHDRHRKLAVFVDSDTNTGWNIDGVAVDGEKDRKGKKLKPVAIQEDVYWGVMKVWYPSLKLVGR